MFLRFFRFVVVVVVVVVAFLIQNIDYEVKTEIQIFIKPHTTQQIKIRKIDEIKTST